MKKILIDKNKKKIYTIINMNYKVSIIGLGFVGSSMYKSFEIKNIQPNIKLFGNKNSYKGSWDDEFVKSIDGYPMEFMSPLFSNVKENKLIQGPFPRIISLVSVMSGVSDDNERST